MNKQNQFEKAIKNNNLHKVILLLNDDEFNPSLWTNYALRYASEYERFDIVTLLLKDNRVNPSDQDNYAILSAYKNEHFAMVRLLWSHIIIKNTLQNNNKTLYNKLKLEDIQNKVNKF